MDVTDAEMEYARSLLKVIAALPCESPPNANNGFHADAAEGIDFINSGKYDEKITFVEEGDRKYLAWRTGCFPHICVHGHHESQYDNNAFLLIP